ncbi:MAG: Ig-like domain-containing protein, partial [Pseudomonadota bacterium]
MNTPPAGQPQAQSVLTSGPALPGLTFRLREGTEAPIAGAGPPLAKAVPLSETDTDKVLARLPPLPQESGDQKDFALREKSLPPPRAGKTVTESFPPPPMAAPQLPMTGAGLMVVRRLPEGDVPLAPHVTVTFSQPMVAVSSQDEAKLTNPVRLSPLPPGSWRWLGTKTILFEPTPFEDQKGGSGRLPMATDYRVEIPAGTKSAIGNGLLAPVSWTFATPPPTLVSHFPLHGGPQVRNPLVLLVFDQRIESRAVLASIDLKAAGTSYPLRLATAEEIRASQHASALADSAGPGRWLAFMPSQELPADTNVEVTIGPGTPSAEGPRRTEQPQSFTFSTYGKLKVQGQSCPDQKHACSPNSSLWIHFTNPLDQEKLDTATMIQVSPEIPNMNVEAWGSHVGIYGRIKGRSKYTIKLAPSLPDEFGQTLGEQVALEMYTGPAEK